MLYLGPKTAGGWLQKISRLLPTKTRAKSKRYHSYLPRRRVLQLARLIGFGALASKKANPQN